MADTTKKTESNGPVTKKADTKAPQTPVEKAEPKPEAKPETKPVASGEPVKVVKPAERAEQYARVRASGVERRCRGGMCFNAEGTVLARSALSDAQWREIADDEHLKVEPAKAPESAAANTDAASVEH